MYNTSAQLKIKLDGSGRLRKVKMHSSSILHREPPKKGWEKENFKINN